MLFQEPFHVRRGTIGDAAPMLRIYAHYVRRTAVSFEEKVPTPEQWEERLTEILLRYPLFVAETDCRVVGYAYAQPFKKPSAYRFSVETTIYLFPEVRRMGVGSTLYLALEDALRRQGIRNMNACIAYAEEDSRYLNTDSIRFHERMGYRKVAHFHQCGYKFERWWDMIWMEKMIAK